MKNNLINELKSSQDFFERSISIFSEEDAHFQPQEGMLTVCQHIAHAARTIDWFLEGMSQASGFSLDFEGEWAQIASIDTLAAAKEEFSNASSRLRKHVEGMTEEELLSPLPEGPIMGSQARFVIISSTADHSAHHRGALAVYTRLLGKVPPMPYGEF